MGVQDGNPNPIAIVFPSRRQDATSASFQGLQLAAVQLHARKGQLKGLGRRWAGGWLYWLG